jgi:3-oxoacyl-[acyl-carrier protein] reductase
MTVISLGRAVVTGGTRGIGRGIVADLLGRGWNVAFSGRDVTEGEALKRGLAGEFGPGRVWFAAADLSQPAGPEALISEAARRLGGIDLIVHCAGIFPEAALGELEPGLWHNVIDVNLTSAMLLVKAGLPFLAESGQPRVVLISSISGPRTGIAGLTHYCASKAGLEGFARAAAVELAAAGITVNCVAPGTILTEALAELYSAEGQMESVAARIPVKRLGTPADIAGAVAFLASSDASYITGQTITVDGGQTLPEVQESS